MKILPTLLLTACVTALNATAAENGKPNEVPAASTAPVPAGDYTLDKAHSTLLFRVDHLGFSHFTARFKRFDAQLHFDPKQLTASQLNVTVDATSIETDYPDPKTIDFNAQLQGEQWLNTAKYPQMTYRSTKIESTGQKSVRVTGDLTLRGVTKPVVLNVTYNGGYAGHPMDPHARVGFSAHGTLKRSDFGISFGIPAPGTTMGVSDEVEIIIECEFTGPPLNDAK
ncbi:MAG TPA: YceI family protein [Steroidobacteraceae bacterium]|nr:YceI family protein [Steroidobacteraceae bacterium]